MWTLQWYLTASIAKCLILQRERKVLYTCTRRVFHCIVFEVDTSCALYRGTVPFVSAPSASSSFVYLQHKSSWYPFIHCDFHSHQYPTSDRCKGTFHPLLYKFRTKCTVQSLAFGIGTASFMFVWISFAPFPFLCFLLVLQIFVSSTY